jgi:hypothetical protein
MRASASSSLYWSASVFGKVAMSHKHSKEPIFTQAYWERPAGRNKGEDGAAKIHQAVGFAISTWERTDQALADLFIVLTGADSGRSVDAIRRAYGSIHGNAGRRAAVLAAAEVYFEPHWKQKAVRQSLIDLTNAVQWASVLRDDLAHGITWDHIAVDDEMLGGFLLPADYNTGRTFAFAQPENSPLSFMKAHYRYISEDILLIASKFSELREKIYDYINTLEDPAGKSALLTRLLGEAPSEMKP